MTHVQKPNTIGRLIDVYTNEVVMDSILDEEYPHLRPIEREAFKTGMVVMAKKQAEYESRQFRAEVFHERLINIKLHHN